MKKRLIECTSPTETKKMGWIATVQQVENILVLNIYNNRSLKWKYCINTDTYEFMSYDPESKVWSNQKLDGLVGGEKWYYSNYETEKKLSFNSMQEEEKVCDALKMSECKYDNTAIRIINKREGEYRENKREKAEERRINRVNAVMEKVPQAPKELDKWIHEKVLGAEDYAFYNKEEEMWICTACEKKFKEDLIHRTDGEKKIRHNEMVSCPRCKKVIQVKKRSKQQKLVTHITLLQPIDDEISVARHMSAKIYWSWAGRKIMILEEVRMVINKLGKGKKDACELYYNQHGSAIAWNKEEWSRASGRFDNKSNPSNRRTFPGYLHETGIEGALENTCYSAWTRLFSQMAAAGEKAHYNKLMIAQNNLSIIGLVECLFKGRFNKLLLETSERISPWSCEYYGPLILGGQTIEAVFDIRDRQKINRLRELDAGEKILKWMRWSDKTGEKISQEVMEWLTGNAIEKEDVKFIEKKISIQKIMNYVKRQQEEEYKGKSAKQVLAQWDNYLRMCEKQKKKTDDEMVYKPRELKRRHNEIVEEIRKKQIVEDMKRSRKEKEEEAKRMSTKFPGAEANLAAVRKKYEYENEQYKIIVPKTLLDIMAEGNALHHCTGWSDRYFDRIMQNETYLCFLRRKEEPKVAYYTIEVEPGGAIRQSRGYLDEEPRIEEIRPFLREWQRVVKERMKISDVKLAKISKQKREANLEELKQKNNTRVLKALMEDFMEAM